MEAKKSFLLILLLAIASAFLTCSNAGVLKGNFYSKTCPRAEAIVQEVVESHVSSNPSLPAKLLRLHFHDCFVRGCDGSVLLNSTADTKAEKAATTNLSLSGFDVIDDIKEAIEAECPGIVSCADILALAARDSVSVQYGKPLWEVLTGRRDGNVSLASEASPNLPAASANFTVLKKNFEAKGLSVVDLVVLSGAHTIGDGHCSIIRKRLFNFTGVGDQDPSLNTTYAELLKEKCTNNTADRTTTVEMDPNSSLSFDNHYYAILEQNEGLFTSDAALLKDKQSSDIVQEMLNSTTFFDEFSSSMKKMGAIGVLTETQGEIRKQCSLVN